MCETAAIKTQAPTQALIYMLIYIIYKQVYTMQQVDSRANSSEFYSGAVAPTILIEVFIVFFSHSRQIIK
jgi:hypothetical protein